MRTGIDAGIVGWMKDAMRESGASGFVVGMSGGLDSSVVAVLAARAAGSSVMGVIMPCHSVRGDMEDAAAVAKKYGIRTETVDMTPVFETLKSALGGNSDGVSGGNLKARLRMTVLYYFANTRNYLVAGTGNKSELYMGYFTKYGDGGADILPLADLLKTEVRELAGLLGVPEGIIKKPPSAGLWEGQTDEEEMGITYTELDGIITAIEKGEPPDGDKAGEVIRRMKASRHKCMPARCFKYKE